ncbi:MAG: hypothetical protein QOI96_1664 [Verrucomicrobiota bacterium]
MLARKFIFIAVIASFICGTVSIRAQDAGALLDLLVRKKLITDQEAEEVRSELTKEVASTAGGKWKLSAPITELELYGDARLRYEYRGGQTPGNQPGSPSDWNERSRERYRLRLGLRGTLVDDWFFGIRLETSTNPRSTNVTFGDDAGPFGKSSDGMNVGQAYIGYRGFKDITLTAGKMANPLVTTLMTWDGDINPEGAAEQWKHSFNFNFGGGSTEPAQGYSKDGKSVAVAQASSEPFKLKVDVFANFAQFVYDDANPENPIGARPSVGGRLTPNTDAWLLAWQVGARFNFPKNFYFQLAPTLYNYTGAGDSFNTFYRGGETGVTNTISMGFNQVGVNSLLIFDMPAEFGWKLGDLPMRIFGDFAVNLEADDRATAATHPNKGDQRYAYQVGLGIGQLKAKKDWQLNVFWQHTEQYSLDPNLVDSDIFDSRVNMEGVAVQAGYALSDAVIFNLTYAHGWRSDNSLGTGGTGDIAVNPLDQYNIFQADLNVKF